MIMGPPHRKPAYCEEMFWKKLVSPKLEARSLVLGLVVAGLEAGRTVKQAILAEADVYLSLAQAAVFLAVALLFDHLALRAAELRFCGSGHGQTVARGDEEEKVPLVTVSGAGVRLRA
jgi:hypothetical protein